MNMPVEKEKPTWRVPLQMNIQSIIRKSARSVSLSARKVPVPDLKRISGQCAVVSGKGEKALEMLGKSDF